MKVAHLRYPIRGVLTKTHTRKTKQNKTKQNKTHKNKNKTKQRKTKQNKTNKNSRGLKHITGTETDLYGDRVKCVLSWYLHIDRNNCRLYLKHADYFRY